MKTYLSKAALILGMLMLFLFNSKTGKAQEVLIIWDNSATFASTLDLKSSLENAGMNVTMSTVSESSWNNTNPSLTGFDVVIRLNGTTYSTEIPTAGQQALVDFVENNNGAYVQFEWDAYQFNNGQMQDMEDLILFERTSGTTAAPTLTEVSSQSNHPVLANVPSSFTLPNTGYNDGSLRVFSNDPSVLLMTDNSGNDALAIREFGSGCILGFHNAGNYSNLTTLSDTNLQQLIIDFIGHCGYCGVDVAASSTGVSCYGDSDGVASVSVSGGVPPYEYEWNTTSTDTMITSLTAGNYTVTVTDSAGCVTVKQITVESPTAIETSVQINNSVSCFGLTNGSAVAIVTGGTAPFSYAWNNGETADTAFALPQGNAIVTVTDSNGCQFLDTAVIVSPDEIILTYNITPVECDGDEDGAASVAATGGIPPYSYTWSTGNTSTSISNKVNGVYILSITDNAGCEKEDSVVIYPLYPSPEVDLGEDLDICVDWPVKISAGSNGASYNWSTGQFLNFITVATAGTYWVEVTNDSGCVGTDTILVETHTCLGIKEVSGDEGFVVYPNPTTGMIHIEASIELGDAVYKVYDVSGKVAMTGRFQKSKHSNEANLDLTSLQSGNYIIEILSENQSIHQSVVVE
jgi:hypothetical protein